MPRLRVPDAIWRAKKQVRQARYWGKPEIMEARGKANHNYYEKYKESIKAGVRGRLALEGEPAKFPELRARFRIIRSHEPTHTDESLATRNARGIKTNERTDLACILECRLSKPDSPWKFERGSPDLSKLPGLGGKSQNLDL